MHDRASTIANLPGDLPPSDGLRVMPIQEGDYRTGLVPLQVTYSLIGMSSTCADVPSELLCAFAANRLMDAAVTAS